MEEHGAHVTIRGAQSHIRKFGRILARRWPWERLGVDVPGYCDSLARFIAGKLGLIHTGLHFDVVLQTSRYEVAAVEIFGNPGDGRPFYSVLNEAIYLPMSTVRLGQVAHEFGHAIADSYFQDFTRLPHEVSELVAITSEKIVRNWRGLN